MENARVLSYVERTAGKNDLARLVNMPVPLVAIFLDWYLFKVFGLQCGTNFPTDYFQLTHYQIVVFVSNVD